MITQNACWITGRLIADLCRGRWTLANTAMAVGLFVLWPAAALEILLGPPKT